MSLALGTGVALVAWLGVEVAVSRWVEIPPEPYPETFGPVHLTGNALLRYDTRLLWRQAPGVSIPTRIANGTPFTVTTNALGLRDDPFPVHPGSWRVLSLGDSNTWGQGVENHQTYTNVLERLLKEARPGVAVEALNAGVVGYGSAQSLRLEQELLGDRPFDLVLVYTMGCDSSQGPRPDQAYLHGPAVTALLDVAQHSGLFRLARRAVHGSGRAGRNQGDRRAARATPETYRANLTRMVSLARDRGAEVLLVEPLPVCTRDECSSVLSPLEDPSRPRAGISPTERSYHDVMRAVARETGVGLVDLPAQVDGWGPTQAIYIDASHPTVEGHAHIAAAIATEALPLLDRWRTAHPPGVHP